MIPDIFSYAQFVQEQGIILSYSGYISERIFSGLSEALKLRLTADETDSNVVKRVFSVFVEQTQNIIRYSADRMPDPIDLSYGLIVLGNSSGKFFIIAGNRVLNDEVEELRERLNFIQSLDKPGLDKFYRETLHSGAPTKKGAGLGLLEIARRTSEPFTFELKQIDGAHSFFFLRANI